MSGRASFDGRLHYSELVKIIRILKEGLEDIAGDDVTGSIHVIKARAIDILKLMEDTCKSSEIEDIKILPKLLNT